MKRLTSKKYYLSVEGETEKWYFEWLVGVINNSTEAKHKIKLDCKIEKDPAKYVKGLLILEKTAVTHVFDRESEDEVHTTQFQTTLERIKKAESSGKKVKYSLGYSNFSFELWMVLHKSDCNGPKTHRKQYLDPINRAYGEKFENLKECKKEKNFQRILGKLTIEDVKNAITRSQSIMQMNEENYESCKVGNYDFFTENPSLTIWKCVESMLKGCGL